MQPRKWSRRRMMLVSWLGIFVMLTSVLSWLPAAAENGTSTNDPIVQGIPESEATGTGDEPDSSLFETSDTTTDTGTDTSTDTSTDTDTDTDTTDIDLEEVFGLSSVSLACGDDGDTVAGSVVVVNPQDGVSVELNLVAGGSVLRTQSLSIDAGQDTYDFVFDLEPSDAAVGDEVVVNAREAGTDDAPVSSDAVEIAGTNAGATACGVVDEPDVTPTATATSTPTNTPTPSPTPSPTPDDEVVKQLVAQLVAILDEVLNPQDDNDNNPPTKPTPTDPPDSGEDTSNKTAMVSGTGGSGLRCRTAPVNGDVIVVLPEGTTVQMRGAVKDGWAPVRCDGHNGWSSAAYLIIGGKVGSGELWIDVDLTDQYMRVYRGNTVIGQTYVSTGRPGFDTPTGTFRILVKYETDDMEGTLGGEYYFVPDVPWTMYFTNRGHAIHGAYWHNNFGHVMSHGCVNAPVPFAKWLYGITPLGTRVVVHY